MPIQGSKKNELLAKKEKLLQEIHYYEQRLAQERLLVNKPTPIFFEDNDERDSDMDLQLPVAIPLNTQQVKLQQNSINATLELTKLEPLDFEMNILSSPPKLDGEPQIEEDGTWQEVTADCRVDMVPFAISFYTFRANRKFAPLLYRGLKVLLRKKMHEAELSRSVLPQVTTPSDAVEVIRSYSERYRVRKATLARLADKFGAHLHMEPKEEGGYVLKCADLMEIYWTVENKWSPIVPFQNKMSFAFEFLEKQYLDMIKPAHRQLGCPNLNAEENTHYLSIIVDTCLLASGVTEPVVEREVMAPPTFLPKKPKPKDRESNISNQKGAKRTAQEERNIDGAKKRKNNENDEENEEEIGAVANVPKHSNNGTVSGTKINSKIPKFRNSEETESAKNNPEKSNKNTGKSTKNIDSASTKNKSEKKFPSVENKDQETGSSNQKRTKRPAQQESNVDMSKKPKTIGKSQENEVEMGTVPNVAENSNSGTLVTSKQNRSRIPKLQNSEETESGKNNTEKSNKNTGKSTKNVDSASTKNKTGTNVPSVENKDQETGSANQKRTTRPAKQESNVDMGKKPKTAEKSQVEMGTVSNVSENSNNGTVDTSAKIRSKIPKLRNSEETKIAQNNPKKSNKNTGKSGKNAASSKNNPEKNVPSVEDKDKKKINKDNITAAKNTEFNSDNTQKHSKKIDDPGIHDQETERNIENPIHSKSANDKEKKTVTNKEKSSRTASLVHKNPSNMDAAKNSNKNDNTSKPINGKTVKNQELGKNNVVPKNAAAQITKPGKTATTDNGESSKVEKNGASEQKVVTKTKILNEKRNDDKITPDLVENNTVNKENPVPNVTSAKNTQKQPTANHKKTVSNTEKRKKPLNEQNSKISKPIKTLPKSKDSTVPDNMKKPGNTEKENEVANKVQANKITQKKMTTPKLVKKAPSRVSPRKPLTKASTPPVGPHAKKVIPKTGTGIPRLVTNPKPKIK